MNFLLDGAVSYFSKDASWDDYFLRSELLSVPVVSSTIIFTGKITNDKRLKTGRCIAGTAVGSLVGGTALYIYVKKYSQQTGLKVVKDTDSSCIYYYMEPIEYFHLLRERYGDIF